MPTAPASLRTARSTARRGSRSAALGSRWHSGQSRSARRVADRSERDDERHIDRLCGVGIGGGDIDRSPRRNQPRELAMRHVERPLVDQVQSKGNERCCTKRAAELIRCHGHDLQVWLRRYPCSSPNRGAPPTIRFGRRRWTCSGSRQVGRSVSDGHQPVPEGRSMERLGPKVRWQKPRGSGVGLVASSRSPGGGQSTPDKKDQK